MTEVSKCLRLLNERAAQHLGPAILALDGRSGAGKSTLAREIADRCGSSGLRVTTLEVEDFIAGWHGLVAGTERVAERILRPITEGDWPAVARWDWVANTWATPERIPPADVLLLVGCGSSSAACAPYDDVTVWVEAPERTRYERVTKRDGDPADWWNLWADQEVELLRQRNSPVLADFVLTR